MLPPVVINGGCGPSQGDQGIGTDVVSDTKSFSAGVQKVSLQSIFRRKRNAMEKKVQSTELFTQLREHGGYLAILRDITRKDQGVGTKRTSELLDILLQPLPLIGEGESRSLSLPRLSDGPCNGTFVRNPKNDSNFTG